MYIGNLIDPNATPTQDFAPIPSGEYTAVIVDSGMKPTKNNAGQYLELVYKITDGPIHGRQVWARFNLENPNAQAVQIAQQHLAAVIAACGLGAAQVKDSQQLHNIPHVIRVEHVAADGIKRQRDTNEVKAWKRIEGVTAAPAAPTTAPFARPAAPAANAAPAWAQKPAA